MSAIEPSWGAPLLSSQSAEARAAYRDGVVALVAGLPHAERLFACAMELDPDFFLARVARLLAGSEPGRPCELPEVPDGLTLGERQHVAVLREHLTGDPQRAHDLRRQHLADLPGDLLVVWIPSRQPTARRLSAATRMLP